MKPEVGPVALDPAACRADFEWVERTGAFVTRMFVRHPRIEIDYEDLTGSGAAGIEARLLAFLDLPPRPMNTVIARLAEAPLPERISNFAELQRAFDGTRYARFFEESA